MARDRSELQGVFDHDDGANFFLFLQTHGGNSENIYEQEE